MRSRSLFYFFKIQFRAHPPFNVDVEESSEDNIEYTVTDDISNTGRYTRTHLTYYIYIIYNIYIQDSL